MEKTYFVVTNLSVESIVKCKEGDLLPGTSEVITSRYEDGSWMSKSDFLGKPVSTHQEALDILKKELLLRKAVALDYLRYYDGELEKLRAINQD